MKRSLGAVSTALVLCAQPAQAQGLGLPGALMLYAIYGIVAFCLLGWSFLGLLMARSKVEQAARTLGRRPLASFSMGVLCCAWLLLALGLAKAIGPLGGLLVVITISVLMFCALLGLPAILLGLGRRAALLLSLAASPAREVALGAVVLFSAGGLPWLGQLLLLGVAVWATGGAVLSLLAEPPAADSTDSRPRTTAEPS